MKNTLSKTPPETLQGDVARARWARTIETLQSEGRTLPRSNEGMLEGYCAAFELLADCEASIKADGLLVDGGRDGQRRSPALSGKIQALAAIKGFATQLGLSPTSAKGLKLQRVDEKPNPFREFRKPSAS